MITRKSSEGTTARFRYAAAYLLKARAGADQRHVRRAENALAAARRDLTARAFEIGVELQRGLEHQRRLVEQVRAGRLAPEKANERSRKLQMQVELLRLRIADINALLNADIAAVAVEAPDLPVEEYVARVPSRGRSSLWPTRRGFLLWLVVVGCVILAGFLYAGVIQLHAPVTMSVTAIQPGGPFAVTLRNDGKTDAEFLVPTLGTSEVSNGAYTLTVYVRDESRQFRAVECLDCWVYSGATLNEPVRIRLAPNLSAQFTFRPARLRDWRIHGDAVRFALSGPAGEPVSEQILSY